MFVVILTTNIRTRAELHCVGEHMDKFSEIDRWDADLDDPEHVMRIYMKVNLLPRLGKLFRSLELIFAVLNIYHTSHGVAHPLFNETGGNSRTCIGEMLLQNFLNSATDITNA